MISPGSFTENGTTITYTVGDTGGYINKSYPSHSHTASWDANSVGTSSNTYRTKNASSTLDLTGYFALRPVNNLTSVIYSTDGTLFWVDTSTTFDAGGEGIDDESYAAPTEKVNFNLNHSHQIPALNVTGIRNYNSYTAVPNNLNYTNNEATNLYNLMPYQSVYMWKRVEDNV